MKQTLKREQMYLVYVGSNVAHVLCAKEELQVDGHIIKIWIDWQGETRMACKLSNNQWHIINQKFN